MSASAVEVESFEYAECERRLLAWGRWAKRMSDHLGYPRTSGIARMIEMAKVFKPAEKSGEVTAQGKQTRVMRPLTVDDAPVDVMEVDRIVARLPGWMNRAIYRSYLFGQPDRIAARELGVTREVYTKQRKEAVSYVAQKLAIDR